MKIVTTTIASTNTDFSKLLSPTFSEVIPLRNMTAVKTDRIHVTPYGTKLTDGFTRVWDVFPHFLFRVIAVNKML